MITELAENQIFVFGSNLEGNHIGGAARQAYEQFGALWGKGVGMQGRSYAIPTMDGIQLIEQYAHDFMEYARLRPDLEFILTRVGCGIAGHTDAQISPIFKDAPSNVIKPEGW